MKHPCPLNVTSFMNILTDTGTTDWVSCMVFDHVTIQLASVINVTRAIVNIQIIIIEDGQQEQACLNFMTFI
jgi:hypothetical protein